MSVTAPSQIIRFGVFEVDLHTRELRKQGLKLKLMGQPFDVLAMLLEHPGELVTREEIQKKLWPADTFVDFEHGLNTAVKKLREALGDDANNPRFVETLARRGYRFIAPVDVGAHGVRPDNAALGTRRVPLRRVALGGAASVAIIVVLLALNVGGLPDKLMTAVGAGLARPREGGALPYPKIESLAVLPLENLSGDKEQEYFADGMTDELITELGQVSSLRVISRTSMMRFKGAKKPLPEIARELNVQGIVEGSVLRSENWVRVTVNLIEAKSDRHLWSHSYESELRDVLKLQSRLARDITQQIQATLTSAEQSRLSRPRPVNLEARELYLKGRYEWEKRTEEGLRKSLEYFQQAIDLDPSYAQAYAGLADAYCIMGNNRYVSSVEAYPKARTAALEALKIDADLAEGHASLGGVLFDYDLDHEGGLRELRRAIELNPGYATSRHYCALLLSYMGQHEEAIQQILAARRLDPLSPRINKNVGLVLYHARQYERSATELQKALDLEPDNFAAHEGLGFTYLEMNRKTEALAEMQKHLSLQPNSTIAKINVAYAYAVAGRRRQALQIVSELKQMSQTKYASPARIATVFAALGDRDQAFAWLDKAVAVHDRMNELKVDPAFDPLRTDPRFQDLLRRMNFPP